MSKNAILLTLFVFIFSVATHAAGDATKGAGLYKTCVQCHGENGRGNPTEEAPMIAGQYDWYIVSSIKQFKEGKERKNPKMLPYIKNLSDKDIEDLAAYISSMK
ncbi:MAG: c-type cytochrome [Halobacteriovoraceae bacterium]|nr:c-type cytochrome [Halobacteriovoraceae bacterium]